MAEIISYCGLLCSDCGAYIATVADDDEKRAEVARQWSEMYEANLSPSDINCEGCLSDGPRVFHHDGLRDPQVRQGQGRGELRPLR